MTTTPDPLSFEPSPSSSSSNPAGPASPAPGAGVFDAIRRLGIVRPDSGRWAAGVAAGIGRRYGLDPVVVRIAFVALTLFGGLGVTLYGLGWLLLPHPDGRIHAQQVLTGVVTPGFVAALILALCSMHGVLPIALVALVVFLVVRSRRPSTPHAA